MEMKKRNRHNYEILIEEGIKAKRLPEPAGMGVVLVNLVLYFIQNT